MFYLGRHEEEALHSATVSPSGSYNPSYLVCSKIIGVLII